MQLLQQLLPLASARGWDSVNALVDALAPTATVAELVYTFEINLDEVLESWLVEKTGSVPTRNRPRRRCSDTAANCRPSETLLMPACDRSRI